MYTGYMQLDGKSELYSNERTYSTSLCARHRQLEGIILSLSLNCDCAHKLSWRNVCCVWHVCPYTGYRQLDGTSELYFTLLCVHPALISCHSLHTTRRTILCEHRWPCGLIKIRQSLTEPNITRVSVLLYGIDPTCQPEMTKKTEIFHHPIDPRGLENLVVTRIISYQNTLTHNMLHFTWITKALYASLDWSVNVVIRWNGRHTNALQTERGAMQCCILSPHLFFNLYSESAIREAEIEELGIKTSGNLCRDPTEGWMANRKI